MGMKSIKDIYKIGKGPSSSHTMGPFKSVRHYVNRHTEARKILVTLYPQQPIRLRVHFSTIQRYAVTFRFR